MDGNPLSVFLNPWTVGAMVASPFIFQGLKALVGRFLPEGSALPKQWAAVLHVVSLVSVVAWQGVAAGAGWLVIAGQCLLAVIAAELVYQNAVQPMSKSANPLVP